MNTSETLDLRELRALIATIVTTGYVDDLYAAAHEEMRVHNEREGFQNIEYRKWPAVLVESGRDEAVKHALNNNYHVILQIDADMAPFPPDAYIRLLRRLYVDVPFADCVGAYCNLKGHPFLPTIDTGTGTWENHYPGSGLLEVIRTGAAFVMCKNSAFRRLGPPPWYRARTGGNTFAALRDVDNVARCWLSGRNRLSETPEWTALLMEARKRGGFQEHSVGEDSGFCDRLKAVGGRIFVDTDIAVGHVGKQIIDWQKHKEAIEEREKFMRLAVGVMS